MLMSVPQEHTTVFMMFCAIIPRDHLPAPVSENPSVHSGFSKYFTLIRMKWSAGWCVGPLSKMSSLVESVCFVMF